MLLGSALSRSPVAARLSVCPYPPLRPQRARHARAGDTRGLHVRARASPWQPANKSLELTPATVALFVQCAYPSRVAGTGLVSAGAAHLNRWRGAAAAPRFPVPVSCTGGTPSSPCSVLRIAASAIVCVPVSRSRSLCVLVGLVRRGRRSPVRTSQPFSRVPPTCTARHGAHVVGILGDWWFRSCARHAPRQRRPTNRWSRPRPAWWNVANFHVYCAIFAPASVSGGGSPQAFGSVAELHLQMLLSKLGIISYAIQ